jgi:hypothetical protein
MTLQIHVTNFIKCLSSDEMWKHILIAFIGSRVKALFKHHEDGGSMDLWNVGILSQNWVA